MLNKCSQFKELLKKLKKNELINIINDYNMLINIKGGERVEDYKSKKKDNLIKIIDTFKYDYFKYIIMLLDKDDFEVLKVLTNKKSNIEYLNEHKDLINYLIDKRILWQNDNIEICIDAYELIKSILKDKEVSNCVRISDTIYKLVDGVIIAYGVVDRNFFDIIMKDYENIDDILKFNYKKDYQINDKMLVSNKLTNKERINRYYKDMNYKEFSKKELIELGSSTYHKNIKAYKRVINILKSNYVFKKSDIDFVDKNIIIPYLYNSLNEEDIAKKNLEDTVVELFEFKGDKLKEKMLREIVKIRDEFPLWEYRGFTRSSRI